MPLFSRRDLISTGALACATALFPHRLFSLPAKSSNSAAQSLTPIAERTEELEGSPYSTREQDEILNLARHAFTKLFAGKTVTELQSNADRLGLPPAQRLNITLRHAGRIRGSMTGSGKNLGRQVVDSVFRAAMDRRYGGHLTRWEMPDTLMEVWIQVGSSEIAPAARSEKNILLLGVEGVEIEGRGKSAYYIPSVAITSKYRNEMALLEALCKKARLEQGAWRRPEMKLRKTQWICLRSMSNDHFFGKRIDSKGKLPIRLDRCIEESTSYLIRNQDVTGGVAYLYDPIADLFVTTKKTNLVRAAGCLFALSQVLQSGHHIAAKGNLKACTIQMARGLLDRTFVTDDGRRMVEEEKTGSPTEGEASSGEQVEEGESARKLVEEEERLKELPGEDEKVPEPAGVGATALLAAALGADALRKEFAQEYQQLYRSIVSAQKPGGRMVTYFGEAKESERLANFYPGEALLVLAMEAERKNSEALEMCRRAFQPYVLSFRAAPASAFIVWHINVWSRIALLTAEHAYADFVFEQADWLLQLQIKNHHDPRWIGGFSQSGATPQVYTTAFTEAIVRALTLAAKTGDTERTRKYAECVRSGLRFCRLLQIEETQASLLANPLRCKGGIAFGLTDRRVRCDSVQHFITLCLAVEQVKNYL